MKELIGTVVWFFDNEKNKLIPYLYVNKDKKYKITRKYLFLSPKILFERWDGYRVKLGGEFVGDVFNIERIGPE